MKKNLKLNITDLRNTIKDKQFEMKTIIKEKYKGYETVVSRAINGGIYVGLLGKGSRKLQEEYKTDNIMGLMDFNLLKLYYETLCEIVKLLKNNHYAIYESGADEEIFTIVKNCSYKHKDKFKKENKLSPKNYLHDLATKAKLPITNGVLVLDINNYESIESLFNFNLKVLKSQNLKTCYLDDFRDKLKKEIQNLMTKRFANVKGYGEITGKIYNSFYDFSSEEIKTILKEQDVKAKSVSSVLTDNHKLYINAILKSYLEYMQTENNEYKLRIIASSLGNAAKENFIKSYGMTPLHDLIVSNRYNYVEQTMLEEEKQQVRTRKKSISELHMESHYNFDDEEL